MALNIFRFLQLMTTGLYTGLLFADRIGVTPIRPKLSASSFVLFQQHLHIRFGILMPVLLGVSLLSGLISLLLLRHDYQNSESENKDNQSQDTNIEESGSRRFTRRRRYTGRAFIFTALAILCTVFVIVLTRWVNVPINEALMTWQASAPPPNVMQLWSPWEQAHTIRTIVSLAGFSSLLIGVLGRRS